MNKNNIVEEYDDSLMDMVERNVPVVYIVNSENLHIENIDIKSLQKICHENNIILILKDKNTNYNSIDFVANTILKIENTMFSNNNFRVEIIKNRYLPSNISFSVVHNNGEICIESTIRSVFANIAKINYLDIIDDVFGLIVNKRLDKEIQEELDMIDKKIEKLVKENRDTPLNKIDDILK